MAPRIFLSSTIQDLGDVRSATRYFLEEYGFEVLTSETADFPHSLEGEAWKAALEPIELADYYVLIIGNRAGWITPDGISVTRAEFRRARELNALAGRPRPLIFVRQTVLRAYRARTNDGPVGSDDWIAICAFLDEITEAKSERDSTWVHEFAAFHDVATALRTALRLTGPLRKRIQEANLLEEFYSNMEALLVRVREVVGPVSRLPSRVPKDAELLDRDAMSMLTVFRMRIPGPGRLSIVAVQDAIASGEFLLYDPSTGAMTAGPIQQALLRMRQRVARYELLLSLVQTGPYAREFASMLPIGGSQRPSSDFLSVMWAMRDELENVQLLTQALVDHVLGLGAEWVDPPINPSSPDAIEAARIDAEVVGRDAVIAWLRKAASS
jgi:hypothetical protein